MKLRDKVAIVTGSGRGIGKAIALCLAKEGAKIVINDIDSKNMKHVVDEIKIHGGKAFSIEADVANRINCKKLIDESIKKFGTIDILVNNAGISRHSSIIEMSENDWNIVLEINLKGTFNCLQAVSKKMISQGYGKIINISSIAGIGGSHINMANYAASKAGVIQLTKVAAQELGPYGINVNSVAPGTIITEMTYERRSESEARLLIDERKKQTALKKIGTPEDIANAVLFLATDESSFITGQVIKVDGGRIDLL